MSLRSACPRVCALLAAFAIATISAASAKGVTLIQPADGSVRTYTDVNIRLSGQTLWLRSADRKGVLKIVTAACSFVGGVQRCLPYGVSLIQDGKMREIPILHGTVYLNLSNAAEHLPLSSEELAPHTMLALWRTVHGTYVTIKGKLDEVAP